MPEEYKFDEAKALAKLEEVENYLLTFKGKAGYNPFVSIDKNVTPLRTKFSDGDRTKELFDKIMALEKKQPIVVPANVTNPPRENNAAGASTEHAAGQTVMQQPPRQP